MSIFLHFWLPTCFCTSSEKLFSQTPPDLFFSYVCGKLQALLFKKKFSPPDTNTTGYTIPVFRTCNNFTKNTLRDKRHSFPLSYTNSFPPPQPPPSHTLEKEMEEANPPSLLFNWYTHSFPGLSPRISQFSFPSDPGH